MGPEQAAVAAARNTPSFIPLPLPAARIGYDSSSRLILYYTIYAIVLYYAILYYTILYYTVL